MYNLCKLRTNESNGSVGGHSLDIIKRSESIDEIFAEIEKRVRDGCVAGDGMRNGDCPHGQSPP